jgi:hypothetical protein
MQTQAVMSTSPTPREGARSTLPAPIHRKTALGAAQRKCNGSWSLECSGSWSLVSLPPVRANIALRIVALGIVALCLVAIGFVVLASAGILLQQLLHLLDHASNRVSDLDVL